MVFAQSVSLGSNFGAYIDADGNLFTWGANESGQLGIAGAGTTTIATLVEPAGVWAQVSVSSNGIGTDGDNFVLAVRTDGSLWAWGANSRGQLGLGDILPRPVPTRVGVASDWAEVSAGGAFAAARKTDGRVFVWGDNAQGQLARPQATEFLMSPVQLDDHRYIAISAGFQHALAIRSTTVPALSTSGTLHGWGNGGSGQIGHTESTLYFAVRELVRVGDLSTWNSISAGIGNSLGIIDGGTLYSWGVGYGTGLGSPSTVYKTPKAVSGGPYTQVSTLLDHTLALRADGTVYGWGNNTSLALGFNWQTSGGQIDQSKLTFSTPVALPVPAGSLAVAAGAQFSAVVTADGQLLTAGVNDTGQLANGGTSQSGSIFATSTVGIPDLTVSEVNLLTANPLPGGNLATNIFIRNQGTGPLAPATPGLTVSAVLSLNAVPGDSADIPLTFAGFGPRLPVTSGIAAGSVINLPATLELPPAIPAGEYYVLVTVDADGVVDEISETNNTSPSTTTVTFRADLVVTVDAVAPVPAPFPIQPGDGLEVTLTITNNGTGTVIPASVFPLDIFLSPSASSTALGRVNLLNDFAVSGTIPPAGSISLTFAGADALILPEATPLGSYFLGVKVNRSGVLAESNFDNNEGYSATALVQVAGVDIGTALDNTLLPFSLSGDGLWFGQSNVFEVGGSAAQSPLLQPGQSASIITSVLSSSIITFRWRSETSSPNNFLRFEIGGVEVNAPGGRISGNTDWTTASFVVPANTDLSWTYVMGDAAAADRVFVDNVTTAPVLHPDFFIDSITGQAGTYILGADQDMFINVVARNQGTAATVGGDFLLRFYLSQNETFDPAEDILIKTLAPYPTPRTIGADGTIALSVPITLTTAVPNGSYRLIAVIDADDVVVEIPGIGEDNNLFVAAEADVVVTRRPDLQVGDIQLETGYYFAGEEIVYSFEILNTGTAALNQPLTYQVILSEDATIGNGDDFVAGTFTISGGLAVNGSRQIGPNILSVGNNFPFGKRLFLGIRLDPDGQIPETNENNNSRVFPSRDIILSRLQLEQAANFDTDGLEARFNRTPPFGSVDLPFFGQNSISLDGQGAVQSLKIGDGESSSFETTITTPSPTILSFFWKVSSELVVQPDGTIKRDTLNFYVNDFVTPVRTIAGEVDWTQVNVSVPAGTHSLKWSYVKDGSGSGGMDAGWVDRFTSQVPDLVVDPITLPAGSFTPGSALPPITITIRNTGLATVPASPSYLLEARLTQTVAFGGPGDVVLGTIPISESIPPGGIRTVVANFTVPPTTPAGNYYLGVEIDSTNVVPEASVANNRAFTSAPLVTVSSPISISDALDSPESFIVGGTVGWFTVSDAPLPDGSRTTADGVDALQSGPIPSGGSSWTQTTVTGPQILTYRTKVSSRQNQNRLIVSVNGIDQQSFSGYMDWDFSAGAFVFEYLGDRTAALAADSPLADIEAALNALPSMVAAGGVSVTGTPFNYTFTFNDNGPRSFILVFPTRPELVTSPSYTPVSFGSASTPAEFTVALNPLVTFAAQFENEQTGNLSYLADASALENALNALPAIVAAGGVTVVQNGRLDFDITFNNPGARAVIGMDKSNLRRDGTLDTTVLIAGDGVTAQVQRLRIGPEISLFIPAGLQEVRWTYVKTATSTDNDLDAAWIDQVNFSAFPHPELAITKVNYTPGEYVLDVGSIAGVPTQKLGTRFFDITVEAENFGQPVPVGSDAFTSASIEVRLSQDRTKGNADDIILGRFNQVEGNFESQGLMRFLGPIPLGDDIPAGNYYVIVTIDPTDAIEEFDTSNNVFISEQADVQITRLPDLRLYHPTELEIFAPAGFYARNAVEFDQTKVRSPGDPFRGTVRINNRGLNRIEATQSWNTRVSLRGILRETLEDPAFQLDINLTNFAESSTPPLSLGTFSVQRLMQGRRAGVPSGDIVEIDMDVTLPPVPALLSIIEDGKSIEDYVYYLQVDIDPEVNIRESDVPNTWLSVDILGIALSINTSPPASVISDAIAAELGLFDLRSIGPLDQFDWLALYPGASLPADLLAYAFGRNPNQPIPFGPPIGSLSVTELAGEEYPSITFDFLGYSVDLRYRVQVSNNLVVWSDILVIDGPYWNEVGPFSLLGDGGLIENPLVLSIVDFRSTQRITVRDVDPMGTHLLRFMRVQAELK